MNHSLRLPFYSLIKVIFTLWLVLPQTKGSTYLYVNYLGPFLQSHEDDIDIALESARQKAGKAAGQWLAQAWEHLRSTILGAAVAGTGNNTSNANPTPEIPPSQAGPTHPPPTMHDPLAGSANQLLGLVKRYGPMAAAGVVSAMDRAAHAAGGGTSHPNAIPNDQSLTDSTRPTSAAAKRKANLEAQLNERSRQASDSDDREPWSSSASASASDTEVASTTASSRVSKIRKAERDLGGSYQLVDDEGQKTNVDQASSTSIAASPSRGGGWTAWLRGSASPAQAPSTSPS